MKQEVGFFRKSYVNMAEEISQPLLKKHYYENCPGCKVDKAKETTEGVPIRHLLNIWMVVMSSSKLRI